VRGTDKERKGPVRLTASGLATPGAVKRAAFLAFGVAGAAGLVLAATTAWWLVAVGLVSVAAAWFYTGGSRPYGYLGLGEVMVFVFFGLVAVVGTTYVQTEHWSWAALWAAVGVGALACAILVVNNLRDIPTDTVAGKRTLAVVLGDRRTRVLYAAVGVGALACAILVANNVRDVPTDRESGKRTLAVVLGDERSRYLYALLVGVAAVALVALGLSTSRLAWLGFAFLLPAVPAARLVLTGTTGRGLVPVLQKTGVAELLWSLGAFVGLLLATT
jgi:1,4-dihydroxy-2-naphthoate octaprenyltransferase